MNIEENIREENIPNANKKEDQKIFTPENSVINILEGTNTISITEEDQPTVFTPQTSQENAVQNSNNFLPNGSKVNIDFGLNSLQFVINSQDIYAKEPENKESIPKAINNSYLNDIQKSEETVKVNVPNEKSKEQQKNVTEITDNTNNPTPLIYMAKTKRKRGRPLKGTYTKKTSEEKFLPLKQRNFNRASSLSKTSMYLNADINESDEIGGKLKRRRKSRKMKDYVTDFNSSDEEETKPYNILMENQPQCRRNVSVRNINKQNHIKDTDTFHMDIDDNLIFESDFLNESSLEISESDSEISQSSQIENHKHVLEIGPEKKTKLEIINTGEVQTIQGSDNIIYHLVTTTDNTSTISELLVPNTVKNKISRNTPCNELGSINKTSNSTSRILSSSENKLKGKLERSYKRKLADIRQKVNLHLNEIRRQPSSASIPEVLNAASNFLTEEQLVFLSMQLKTNNDQTHSTRFSVREKLLSLALYQQSPSVYKYLTTVFHLPSKLVLERWLEGVANADPLQAKKIMYHVYAKYIYRV